MKLAIVGSRTFDDYDLLTCVIHRHIGLCGKLELVSGGAKGADNLAEKLAEREALYINIIKPDWNELGKSAGFIRNQKIVDACDMVLAFWDGESKGTKHTIDLAKRAKKPTFIVYFEN